MEESIVRSFPERTLNYLRNPFLFTNPYQGVLHFLRNAIFIVLTIPHTVVMQQNDTFNSYNKLFQLLSFFYHVLYSLPSNELCFP